MVIRKFDRFCTTGTRIEPSTTLKQIGYSGASQVASQNFNWLQGESIDKLNNVIADSPFCYPADDQSSSNSFDALIKNYIPADDLSGWAFQNDVKNKVSAGSSKVYMSLRLYLEDTDRKILALDCIPGSTSIDVFNAESLTLESNSGTLGSLPSGSGETWYGRGMCTDGQYVYVVFANTNASPDVYRVQAYSINGWTRKSAWPTTGVSLLGSGDLSSVDRVQIEFVSDTQIGIACRWVSITSSSSAAIQILDSTDGTIDGSGAGDNPISGGGNSRYLCGDGTYIYYTDDTYNISSLTISAPTTGCGGTNWPYTDTDNSSGIIHTGRVIITVWEDARIGFSSFENGTPVIKTSSLWDDMSGIVFDGLNIWSILIASEIPEAYLACISLGIGEVNTSTYFTLDHIIKELFKVNIGSIRVPFFFDGRDIFISGDIQSGQTNSGNINRIPKACIRG